MEREIVSKLKITSPVFSDGEKIPRKYGYTKKNINPPLEISSVPENTRSLALVMDDPDAIEPAGKVWDHWVLWNIPPKIETIEEDNVPNEVSEGRNDYKKIGYGGPNPPDKEHTYIFKLYALDSKLDLKNGSTKSDLEEAMKGHIIDKTKLTGTYAP
ncbi:MAG: YbhB/YbcL family Raf kinase inhibitor-like protein [Thermoplasmatota archaeon]